MQNLKYFVLSLCLLLTLPSFSQEMIVRSEDTATLLDEFFLSKYLRFFEKEKDNLTFTEAPNVSTTTNLDSLYKNRLDSLDTDVPLSYNSYVKNYIEVYVNRKRKHVNVMLALSQYYFPIFEQALAANGLPEELKYLAIIESGLNPRAVSRMGASGLWQFMYKTGKMYDLDISSGVDERYDPEKSSMAAARYLKDLYNSFGDWTLAIAAYNCGPGNVNKAIRKAKGNTDFWKIYSFLPKETRSYVPAFIGATYIMNYYQEHGYYPPEEIFPTLTDTLMIANDINLAHISSTLNIPLQAIKDLNPQYTRNVIPGNTEQYSLRLPINLVTHFIEFHDTIVYLTFNDTTKNHNKETFAGETEEINVTYRVKPKETLFSISRKFNVSIEELMAWNKLKSSAIFPNQVLKIQAPKNAISEINRQKVGSPASEPSPNLELLAQNNEIQNDFSAQTTNNTVEGPITEQRATNTNSNTNNTNPKPSTTEVSEPKTKNTYNNTNRTKPAPTANAPSPLGSSKVKESAVKGTPNPPKARSTNATPKSEKIIFYTVKKGDTLFGICKRHPGSSVKEVIKINNLTKNGNIIHPNQVLKIKI